MKRLLLAGLLGLGLFPAAASAGHADDYGCRDSDRGGYYDDGDRYEDYGRSYRSGRYSRGYRDYDDDGRRGRVYHHVHRRVHRHYYDHGDHYHVRRHVHRRVHHHYDH